MISKLLQIFKNFKVVLKIDICKTLRNLFETSTKIQTETMQMRAIFHFDATELFLKKNISLFKYMVILQKGSRRSFNFFMYCQFLD